MEVKRVQEIISLTLKMLNVTESYLSKSGSCAVGKVDEVHEEVGIS